MQRRRNSFSALPFVSFSSKEVKVGENATAAELEYHIKNLQARPPRDSCPAACLHSPQIYRRSSGLSDFRAVATAHADLRHVTLMTHPPAPGTRPRSPSSSGPPLRSRASTDSSLRRRNARWTSNCSCTKPAHSPRGTTRGSCRCWGRPGGASGLKEGPAARLQGPTLAGPSPVSLVGARWVHG